MAILSKVYIIACLLLNVLMCQRQEHLDYSLNRHHPQALAMRKYPRSHDWEDHNPILSSQMEVAICPAEDPNEMRYEKYPHVKQNWKNIVKDEDDGEDLDVAAGDDDDEGDEADSTGVDDSNVDDPAFVARIYCLMSALDKHIKTIVCDVNNIGLLMGGMKPTGISDNTHEDNEPQHQTKCSKKTHHYQEKQKDNQGGFNVGLTHIPFHVQIYPKNIGDLSPQGFGTHSQDGGEVSLPRSGFHLRNRGEFTLPGSGIHLQKIIYPLPEMYNHEPYEEYETKLRRLIANRDAIERNVMKMLAPRQGERM